MQLQINKDQILPARVAVHTVCLEGILLLIVKETALIEIGKLNFTVMLPIILWKRLPKMRMFL